MSTAPSTSDFQDYDLCENAMGTLKHAFKLLGIAQ